MQHNNNKILIKWVGTWNVPLFQHNMGIIPQKYHQWYKSHNEHLLKTTDFNKCTKKQ